MNAKLRDELNKRISSGRLATDIDLHVHTVLSDGRCSAEEMVLSAIDKGIRVLGFSDHSPVSGEAWCMTPEEEAEYRVTVTELKEKYKDKIQIFCGIEQEAVSGRADPFYDYVIGSAHAVKAGDTVVWADNTSELVQEAVDRYYGGDYYAYADAYFDGVSVLDETTGCDIVGHLDLVTKFNEGDRIFDTSHPQYIRAWKRAADRLSGKGLIFEINTGGIARGYRTVPYPAPVIIAYLREKGEAMMLNSDSHETKTIAFEFDRWAGAV